jgi:NADH-quinone oxidoreductase subunit F
MALPLGPSPRFLTENFQVPGIDRLEIYQAHHGYEGLKKALAMQPDGLVEEVKKSGLRGRGGAGFATGLKWTFLPKTSPKPRYLVVNGDESEPGTFKDRMIMEVCPHLLVEGVIITSYATNVRHAFIYIRGEMLDGGQQVEKAVQEAYAAGFLGKNILGSGFDLEITVHHGAGAYICGEESALLESLEGKRGYPRLKPPFPAVVGLYAGPTVINNVETMATLPAILRHGADVYAAYGTEKSKGTRLYCLSGHVNRPGNYELPLGTPLRALIEEYGGGIRLGRKLKAFTPGGSSAPLLAADKIDMPLDYESVATAGSMLGSGGVIVMDDQTCIVDATLRMPEFYREESCGKCTP